MALKKTYWKQTREHWTTTIGRRGHNGLQDRELHDGDGLTLLGRSFGLSSMADRGQRDMGTPRGFLSKGFLREFFKGSFSKDVVFQRSFSFWPIWVGFCWCSAMQGCKSHLLSRWMIWFSSRNQVSKGFLVVPRKKKYINQEVSKVHGKAARLAGMMKRWCI